MMSAEKIRLINKQLAQDTKELHFTALKLKVIAHMGRDIEHINGARDQKRVKRRSGIV
jgi:hypothetical protein